MLSVKTVKIKTMTIEQILFLVITYLIAAIPFGLVITKIFTGKDIRTVGSRNIGATNVTRIAGKKLGLVTLILDALKGAAMVLIAQFMQFESEDTQLFFVLVAAIAVIGHVFPVYLKFKGGKGVATTLAVILALNPVVGLMTIIVWISTFVTVKISSVSSLVSSFSTIFISYYYLGLSYQTLLFVFLFFVILFRHKENITRLIKGEEKTIK